jgi:hypothetical protein
MENLTKSIKLLAIFKEKNKWISQEIKKDLPK